MPYIDMNQPRCTCVPDPKPLSHLPPHPIPLGCPSAPALSTLFHASNLDWSSTSYVVIYMIRCYSVKSSHPLLVPQSPKVCSLYLCLFCCLTYRVIITIFLNSIHMCWTSLVAQTVKCLSTMRETQVRSLGWEDPLEKEMAIHSSTIAWKIPWTEEPSNLQSMGSQRVGHDWATSLTHLYMC